MTSVISVKPEVREQVSKAFEDGIRAMLTEHFPRGVLLAETLDPGRGDLEYEGPFRNPYLSAIIAVPMDCCEMRGTVSTDISFEAVTAMALPLKDVVQKYVTELHAALDDAVVRHTTEEHS